MGTLTHHHHHQPPLLRPQKPYAILLIFKIHLKKLQNLLCPGRGWSEICQTEMWPSRRFWPKADGNRLGAVLFSQVGRSTPCCFCWRANAAVRKNPNTYFQLFPCQRQRWGRHVKVRATDSTHPSKNYRSCSSVLLEPLTNIDEMAEEKV